MFSDDRLTDSDVEALLTDAAECIDYPREPNFSDRIRRELVGLERVTVHSRLRVDDSFPAPSRVPSAAPQPSTELPLPTAGFGGWRQALRIVAVGVAVLVVGLLVVIVLREMRAEPDHVANTARPELRDVFITTFSDSTGADDYFSYLAVRDAETLETIYTVPVDLGGWFTISPDGTRLYAAGDRHLTAVDLRTGGTVWEVPLTNRHLRELGIPGLAAPVVSPDGRRLYLYGTETGFTYWTEEIEAATGETIRVSDRSPNPSSGCNARMYPSPDGESLYLPCRRGRIAILDLATMQWIEPLDFPSLNATQPGNGEHLYAIAETGEIAVIDMNDRSIGETAQVIDLSQEDQNWTIAQAAVSRDDETLAVVLTDEVIRGPVFARQYRLYDVGSWEEINRVTSEEPNLSRGLTPDHSGSFLIAEEDEDRNLIALRLDQDGLKPLGHSLSDGTDANYHRTVVAEIAQAENSAFACRATPQTNDQEVRERFEFGDFRTVETADMYVNFWGAPKEGGAIGYTAKMAYPEGYEEGGWYYITLQFVFPDLDREIEISGYRIDGPGDLRFGETDRPDVSSDVWPSPGLEAIGRGSLRRVDARVDGPGCYGLVLQWDDNYETVVFEVVE